MRRKGKIYYIVTKVFPILRWRKCCICGDECRLELMYAFKDTTNNNTTMYICRSCKPDIKNAHSYAVRWLSREPITKKFPEIKLLDKFKKVVDKKRDYHIKRKK